MVGNGIKNPRLPYKATQGNMGFGVDESRASCRYIPQKVRTSESKESVSQSKDIAVFCHPKKRRIICVRVWSGPSVQPLLTLMLVLVVTLT